MRQPIRSTAVVLVALVAWAVGVRLYAIDEPVLTFHPTRQYRSAIIARACYDQARPDASESQRRISVANRAMQPAGEPTLLEWAACLGYRVVGRETLAIPRTLSVVFWVAGVIPLVLIAGRVSSGAALIAAAIYLFTPYGIVASRAFQPDPLMTCCALISLWLLLRDHERGKAASLAVAVAAVAITVVVKPMSVFLVGPAALGLAVARVGMRRAATDRHLAITVAFGLLPAILYYGWSAAFGTLARDQMQLRFVPSLLDTTFFWNGWLTQIRRVFGVPLFLVSLAGTVLARERWTKALLASLWAGYVMFAVAFTYHVPTHDYYHLPFIGAAALGCSIGANRLFAALGRLTTRRTVDGVAALLAVVVASAGTAAVWPRLSVGDTAARLRAYEEIGEACAHDGRVLFLDREYGYPLMYHARIAGDAWPSADDLAAEQLGGAAPLDAAARFRRDFEDYHPHYFVATDLSSLEKQPDLEAFLRPRTTLVASTSSYRIYRFNPR